jgi:hypothetical protein
MESTRPPESLSYPLSLSDPQKDSSKSSIRNRASNILKTLFPEHSEKDRKISPPILRRRSSSDASKMEEVDDPEAPRRAASLDLAKQSKYEALFEEHCKAKKERPSGLGSFEIQIDFVSGSKNTSPVLEKDSDC